ncbi:lysine--tRNA ligase [Candidatus Peregrinibacteria bacterium]|nr:lysine--tRNA ligase [Candidatus Peregrinibacteria bacterium]
MENGRINFNNLDISKNHWGMAIAEKVIERFPDEEIYTCAAGISPSGVVHFGNFRDVMTCVGVYFGLKKLGKNVRIIFSWDNYDRFRKVPVGIPEKFEKYIGMPYTAVPSPVEDGAASYAEHFQKVFEASMKELGIEMEFKDQTEKYTKGEYAESIVDLMKKRKEIARVLLSYMSDKAKSEKGIDEAEYIENYYPIGVYSSFNGTDITEIINYDEDAKITYRCKKTGKEEEIDLRKDFQYKLQWKVDWPMRWNYEQVHFEPGGADHASPGGSYDTSAEISEMIIGKKAPVFAGYQFIGIQGMPGKMSGSKGQAISPAMLLEIYQAELLKWLYLRKSPNQRFDLAFDSEIIRQYDEFDREIKNHLDSNLEGFRRSALEMSFNQEKVESNNPIPFRQAVALGQIVQWNNDKVIEISNKLGQNFDEKSIEIRLKKAQAWLEKYNSIEVIKLLESPNFEYWNNMDEKSQNYVKLLVKSLNEKPDIDVKELELLVYGIPKNPELDPKENAPFQKAFFKDVYNLLLAKDRGPRLSTFIWALGKDKVTELLTFNQN